MILAALGGKLLIRESYSDARVKAAEMGQRRKDEPGTAEPAE
jgi:hypothetical protein